LYLSAERSRRALAGRNQELLFARARAELDVDPTAAVATLATLPHDTPGVADLTRLAVDRGVARAVLVGHASEVRTVAFGPEGRLASAGYDRTVRVWDLGARAARVLRGATDRVDFVLFADGGALFAGGVDGLRLWGDGRVLDPAPARQAEWSPDGMTL